MPSPRLIIHGGAGNINRASLPPASYAQYASALRRIHQSTLRLLEKGATALNAATHAVALFEDCELFNCGRGAVFTRDGTIELEASVMVSCGYRKRACGVVLVKQVKNPIKLAREMLVRGETDSSDTSNGGGDGDPSVGAGGAQGHCCLGGETAERLAKEWGVEMVDESYFWTRKRWDEHRRGLKPGDSHNGADILPAFLESETGWDGNEYLPQGTVGCVALDQYGTLCTATSTGGLTNKLPCRIGDTPTIGAGFWAEQWEETTANMTRLPPYLGSPSNFIDGLRRMVGECMPDISSDQESSSSSAAARQEKEYRSSNIKGVAMSGTGNGDSFLRLAATRTAGAIVRFSPNRSLGAAISQIAGPGGELQRSAGDRWGKTGEGEGGIIGIELVDGEGRVVFDFNCGGMFRCWIDEMGQEQVMVFRGKY